MAALILIIDDEPELADAVEFSLRREGFRTRRATSGAEGLRQVRAAPVPDLVLLDLMLPDLSGVEICRQLQASPETARIPVVMLTAKDEEIDRVVGFEVGADDYITKPFSTRELILRLRAVLRRTASDDAPPQERVRFGALTVEPDAHRVWWDDQPLTLTPLELRLLMTLMNRRGRVQTREQLVDQVWGDDGVVSARTVDTQVKRLRIKLGPGGAYIQTIRGVGYCFASSPALS